MERTVGSIALQLTSNWQGGYYFYSIITIRVLNCRSWNELTVPDEDIQRIEKMSRWSEHGYNFTYPNRTNILDDDDADESRYAPSDHEDDGEYPSLHNNDIVEPDISGVDANINDDDAENNTDDANTDTHNDANINTTDNIDVLQPPNDVNT